MSFIKNDKGKDQWSLLPFDGLALVVKVLMHGAKKYTPDNWRAGEGEASTHQRYWDAAMRHMIEVKKGNLIDPESGLPHIAHAACSLLFLCAFESNRSQEVKYPKIFLTQTLPPHRWVNGDNAGLFEDHGMVREHSALVMLDTLRGCEPGPCCPCKTETHESALRGTCCLCEDGRLKCVD